MKRKGVVVFIIVLTILQSLLVNFYNSKNNKDNIMKNYSIENTKKVKYIEEIEKDLNSIKNLNIESYNKVDDKWNISCSISGKKEEVLGFLEKLNNYNIKNYSLGYEKENIVLYLEIISK